MPNIKYLEALYWLRELRTFQRVATHINVSQPAVSARIFALEKQLNCQMVQRNGHSTKLTRIGLEVADHAERMIRINEAIKLSVKRDSKTTLKVALVGLAVQTWGARLKRLIQTEFPDINLEILVGSNEQISQELRADSVDLAFSSPLSHKEFSPPAFVVHYDVGWVARPELVLNLPNPTTVADLNQQELILFPATSPIYSPVQDVLATTDSLSGPRHYADSLAIISDMLFRGYGISAIPLTVVQSELEGNALVKIDTEREFEPHKVACIYASRKRSRLPEEVLKLATQSVNEVIAEGALYMRLAGG